MRYILAAFAALLAATPAIGQSVGTHFVVFNKAGPAWGRFSDHAAASREHFQIYKQLADKGDIVAGGRLDGAPDDPVLGISIFRADVDRKAIRAILENDPLLKAGVTALEYREWTIQMGAIAR